MSCDLEAMSVDMWLTSIKACRCIHLVAIEAFILCVHACVCAYACVFVCVCVCKSEPVYT